MAPDFLEVCEKKREANHFSPNKNHDERIKLVVIFKVASALTLATNERCYGKR